MVLVVLPLRDILHRLGDRFSNLGFPTDKDMIFPNGLVGLAFPCGRGGAGQQVFVLLIGKGGALGFAVIVDNGQLIFFVIGNAVVVLVVLPLRNILHRLGNRFGNLGFPTDKDMIFPNGLVGLALPCGRGSTGFQVFILLLSKGFAVRFAIVINDGVSLVRLPNSIECGRPGHNNAAIGLIRSSCCVGGRAPTEEGIALTGRNLRRNSEGMRPLILRGCLIGLAGRCAGAAVGVIVQREGRQDGLALEIIVRSILAVGQQSRATFAAFIAAAAGPGDVINLVVVNTFPNILCIGEAESVVVDIVLAEINSNIVTADACNGMAVDRIADLDLDTRHGVIHRRMQHDRAVACRKHTGCKQTRNKQDSQHKGEQAVEHGFLHFRDKLLSKKLLLESLESAHSGALPSEVSAYYTFIP